MPQQTTMWRFLKRDSSSFTENDMMVCGNDYFSPPTPAKRARSTLTLNNNSITTAAALLSSPFSSSSTKNDIFSSFYSPPSVHTSSRTLSSPTLSKMDCDDSQMILDCGQKRFGPEKCPTCGMFYTPIDGNDAAVHERYHRELAAPPRFNRRFSSLFICVQEYADGFIYKCSFDNENLRQNRNSCQQFIEEICLRMNEELGQDTNCQRTGCFTNFSLPSNSNIMGFDKIGRQLYVFVNRGADNGVYGILVADHVKFAYRYKSEGYLDEQPRDAGLGVNRIWTWTGARRRGIATRLVECARCNFFFGTPILKKHVAFSDPTTNGLEFAKKYYKTDTKSDSILIYRFG